jgi:hypothetical protein
LNASQSTVTSIVNYQLSSVVTPLQKIWPTTRAGKAMLAGVVVWFVNWVFADERTLFGSVWLKTLIDLASVAALIPLAYLLYRRRDGCWSGSCGACGGA